MNTFNRVCIEDFTVKDGDEEFKLEKGKMYLTSEPEYQEVTVFSKYWVKVPLWVFANEEPFTTDKIETKWQFCPHCGRELK